MPGTLRVNVSTVLSVDARATSHTLQGYGSGEAVHRFEGGVGEALGTRLHAVEVGPAHALVAHRAVQVARVHALADDGEPPRRERDVVVDAAHVAARPGGVALEEVGVAREPARARRVVVTALLAGVGPV